MTSRDYVAPYPDKGAFTCSSCGAYSAHRWTDPQRIHTGIGWMRSSCQNPDCSGFTIWLVALDGSTPIIVVRDESGFAMKVLPVTGEGDVPHLDLDEAIADLFDEARGVLAVSPRSACALMRLVVERLVMEQLERSEDDLNKAIGALVEEGLNPKIQQALDVVRVTGNDSVHPGELIDTDDEDTALTLMKFTNLIVEELITVPNHVAEVYGDLPETKLDGIDNRDGNAPEAD